MSLVYFIKTNVIDFLTYKLLGFIEDIVNEKCNGYRTENKFA